LIAETRLFRPEGRFATATPPWPDRYWLWQAFCLAKQASIGYTACKVGCGKLCHSFGAPDSAGIRPLGRAEW